MAEPIVIRHTDEGSSRLVAGGGRGGIPAARLVLSLALCFLPPLVVYGWLQGGGPIAWILEYLVVVEALAVYRSVRAKTRAPNTARSAEGVAPRRVARVAARVDAVARWLYGSLLAAGALVIFAGLDITPASAFLAWFALVAHGSAGGTIAYLFVVMFTFFSAVFSGVALSDDAPFAVVAMASADLFLCGVILGKKGFLIGAALLFLAALLLLTGRRLGRISARSTLAVAQVALVTALAALPLSTLIARNPVIDGLYSLELSGMVARLFPNFPFLYSVAGYGNSFASTLLGQRPELTSRPVFEVSGPPGATIYLRTSVYDTYTGTGWKLSHYERRRGNLAAFFYEYNPRSLTWSSTGTISVKLMADFYGSLPNTLDTIGFRFPNEKTPSLSYGSLDSGFVLDSPITRGAVITDLIDTSRPLLPSTGFIENLPSFGGHRSLFRNEGRRAASAGLSQGSLRRRYREDWWRDRGPSWMRGADMIPSRYTITPREETIDLQTSALPKEVVDLAHTLLRPTEHQTVGAIQAFLKNNYLYSLTTRAAGPAGDTVDDFLFHSKTGYCVQFATAFAILARLDGIPSRYVTGFLVYLPARTTSTLVTGLSAHAWAEVWRPSVGWTTVEATPPMLASSFSDPQFYEHFNPTNSGATQKELEAVLGNRVPIHPVTHLSPRSRVTRAPGGSLDARAYGAALLGLLSCALLIVLLTRRFAPREVRLRRLVSRIVRRSRASDLPDPGRSGWSVWASALASRHPSRRAVSLRAGDVILQRYFGREARNGRDLRFLERFSRWAFGPIRATRHPARSGSPVAARTGSAASVDTPADNLVQPRGR